MADPSNISSEQWDAVWAAPFPFFSALILLWMSTAGLTAAALHLLKKNQIETLKERISHRDDEVARLKELAAQHASELAASDARVKGAEAKALEQVLRIRALETEAKARDAQVVELTGQLQEVRAELEATTAGSPSSSREPFPPAPSQPARRNRRHRLFPPALRQGPPPRRRKTFPGGS